ncbi:hypothetical protein BCF11_3418 [Collimonas sp. PA-H2]|uniref:hypothetical protein n=1 Tax=Collimonas sp. PA-H2 TaxID=1881062 RepID=UPI000BF5247D|nr:hypothetical protein [Collimonas sp. PA-H2]PFH10980.1 hypothetical protein BCF11_3418 [Collimonas sp. PA-H2]
MIKQIKMWAALVRDIGVILGVPALVFIAVQLYGFQMQGMQAQIAALKEQNEALKERQYDRASTIIKAQKDLSETELDLIEKSINLVGGQKINVRDFNSKLLCLNLSHTK